jgi:hypothetical protein
MQALAARRTDLIARSDQERSALGDAFSGIARKAVFLDAGLAAAQRVHRHRVILGMITVWSVLAPLSAKLWIGRLSWGLPLAIEGFRLAKSFAGARRTSATEVGQPEMPA